MIVIIDYGMGNLKSVQRAFDKTGVKTLISSKSQDLESAGKIVLPGVGSFVKAMENLDRYGLVPTLKHKILEQKTPVLGICLGLHLLTKHSEEGNTQGLGLIDGQIMRFRFDDPGSQLRIPHIGWNDLSAKRESVLLNHILPQSCFYFAHSYYLICRDESALVATTHYGFEFVSVIQKDNIFGTQFHPEKSHANGLKVIKNFVEYRQDA